MTALSRDWIDLLSAFNDAGAEYLIVGAHAMAVYGHIRATKDLDVWVRPSEGNARSVLRALTTFGAPVEGLTEDDLSHPGLVYQIGVPPVRVDILTSIDGVEFGAAWPDRHETRLDGLTVPVLSRHHLIANKRASGRLQDLADVERLEAEER